MNFLGTIELFDCENTLLREIGMKEAKRLDIAKTYSLAMKSSEVNKINWGRVNKAIIERWSLSGLKWIKEKAWSGKAFMETVPPFPPKRMEGEK